MVGEHPLSPAAESLLTVIEQDSVPEEASSLWKRYARQMTVERRGDRLFLHGAGFTSHSKTGWLGRGLYGLERLSYLPYTRTLRAFPSAWAHAKALARDLGLSLTRHEWSSAVVVAILEEHFRAQGLAPKTFAMIGDGDGFLGTLILRRFGLESTRIFAIDLPKTLMFQLCTYQKAFSREPISMRVLPSEGATGSPAAVTFVLGREIERIEEKIDCAINLVSMQEMTPANIQAYFSFLRKRSGPSSRFYCSNRLYKKLPGGEVASFHDYPWSTRDQIFLEGPCPYFVHYLEAQTLAPGPRWLGMRIPWVNHFDGPTWHRLVHLAGEA